MLFKDLLQLLSNTINNMPFFVTFSSVCVFEWVCTHEWNCLFCFVFIVLDICLKLWRTFVISFERRLLSEIHTFLSTPRLNQLNRWNINLALHVVFYCGLPLVGLIEEQTRIWTVCVTPKAFCLDKLNLFVLCLYSVWRVQIEISYSIVNSFI